MEYLKIFKQKSFSCALSEPIDETLKLHLLREDGQEDLTFALWIPSEGKNRFTAIIKEVIFPEKGDRNVHGNVSYNYEYLLRVCRTALKKGYGVALLHSHPISFGWQGMSDDDKSTEMKTFVNAFSTTELPFVGMTLGNDGYWSSRIWYYGEDEDIIYKWSESVKVVGKKLQPFFNDKILPATKPNGQTIRTVNVWGEEQNDDITRLRVGVIGLGSVGSVVCEMLARMGISKFVLIDYDTVKKHNLDRLCGVFKDDIGERKIDVIKRNIEKSSTSNNLEIEIADKHIANEVAYRLSLDCDVLFSCVDKPWGRYILNHIAYAHLIPVIDGGISIEFDDNKKLNFADWTVHTVSPGRPCLHCLNAYHSSDVELEKQGLLEDTSYIQGLPDNHHLKNRENISPFSFNLASMEVLHFMALVANLVEPEYYGEQKYRFKHGFLSRNYDVECEKNCDFTNHVGVGDSIFELFFSENEEPKS
ncbi:ThiF family adenylyltransferase [Carboxylicivirga sediminis]|uniref:ThiF family adenylyltransferase n=1 Tax=Carboxylicivirga sediminis TaxID=2006564 RepID=A0A941F9D8_9BACT|nr:ThiF family adenylyltransferase [Carboxylicivirga sediminis]MBR8537893.1 ThiF family adenylyltransferase [Carboxylicivirga sediminis]